MKRCEEVLQARRSHFFDDGAGVGLTWIVHGQKQSKDHLPVAIPEYNSSGHPVAPVVRLLLRIASTSDALFRATQGKEGLAWAPADTPITLTTWNSILKHAIERVAPATPEAARTSHALRKGGYSAAVEANVSREVSRAIIGHRSDDMWKHLVYYVPSSLARRFWAAQF